MTKATLPESAGPKVVIFSTSEGIWGGSQIFNQSLCRFLEFQGLSAILATPSPELYSCKTLRVNSLSNRLARTLVAISLVRAMRRRGWRTIILDDLSGLWLAPVFYLAGIKVLSILHLELRKKDKRGFGHGWLTYHLLRMSSFFVHHVFSVGRANTAVFPVPVEFLGNFVADAFFHSPDQVSKIYDLGTIGRLSPEKNLSELLHLVHNLNYVLNRPTTCLIAGAGPEKEQLRRLASDLALESQVTFLPWVEREKVPFILDQIKCFAVTSHHEGFPTTILESHARGLPAIVRSSAGFCADFVTGYNHRTGTVYQDYDVKDENFLRTLASLIDSHERYESQCINKASMFREANVLGQISRAIGKSTDAA